MHCGTYLGESREQQPSSFGQIHLADQYDAIGARYLSHLPNEYAVAVASTVFWFAPALLTSPHHSRRVEAGDYVAGTLVRLDGSVEDGEASGWMTTMAC